MKKWEMFGFHGSEAKCKKKKKKKTLVDVGVDDSLASCQCQDVERIA
jgi:hypothetical protein